MTDRRNFLKVLGMSLGGALLTSCSGGGDTSGGGGGGGFSGGVPPTGGDGGGSGSSPLPNSFVFSALAASGTALPGGQTIQSRSVAGKKTAARTAFNGAAMINDQGDVVFHARDNAGVQGIYRRAASSGAITKIVRVGDALPDGSTARQLTMGALNNKGSYVVVIRREDGKYGLYIDRGAGLQMLVTAFTQLSNGVHVSGRFSPHVSLHDNDDLLFSAHYADKRRKSRNGIALFFMPSATPSQTQLVLGHGDVLQGTTSTVSHIGLFMLHEGREFIVHGTAKAPGFQPATPQKPPRHDRMPTTFVARGTVGGSLRLVSAHASVDVASSVRADASFSTSTTFFGPRLGRGVSATVHHLSSQKAEMRINGKVFLVADTAGGGSLSPQGNRIVSVLPPVVSSSGLVFYHVITARGMELCVTNGSVAATVLSRGDTIGGRTVNTIFFGGSGQQANSASRIIAILEFTDKTAALYLGTPA